MTILERLTRYILIAIVSWDFHSLDASSFPFCVSGGSFKQSTTTGILLIVLTHIGKLSLLTSRYVKAGHLASTKWRNALSAKTHDMFIIIIIIIIIIAGVFSSFFNIFTS